MWHLAQWNLLQTLVSERNAAAVSQGSHIPLAAPTAIMPVFLPALIIRGQEWYFVATTRAERKTVCVSLSEAVF